MIRFTDYYGNDIWVVPARVLSVSAGSCGSRGISCHVEFDNGTRITLNDDANRVATVIGEALHA